MSNVDLIETSALETAAVQPRADLLRPLVQAQSNLAPRFAAPSGATIGELIGITDEGCTPLVLLPNQPGAGAAKARTVIDLHGPHIGKKVVLVFEGDVYAKPIIKDLLHTGEGTFPDEQPSQVEVDADGERLIASPKEQIVLRYGKASITLTKADETIIQGTCLCNRSSGVSRIKGGSIQLN